VKCNTCGFKNFELFYRKERKDIDDYSYRCSFPDAKGLYHDMLKCKNCGLVISNHNYKSESIYEMYRDGKDKTYLDLYEYRYRNFSWYLRKILKYIEHANPKLLDIGANRGIFLKVAKDKRCLAYGCELSTEAVIYSEKYFGIEIYNDALENCDLPKKSFDIITMFDTLEHLNDPFMTLKIAYGLLRRNGVLFISTPNIKSLSAKLFGRRWWGLNKSHIYYYDYESLNYLLERMGYLFIEKGRFSKMFPLSYYLKNVPFIKRVGEKIPKIFDIDITMSVGDIFVIYRK